MSKRLIEIDNLDLGDLEGQENYFFDFGTKHKHGPLMREEEAQTI